MISFLINIYCTKQKKDDNYQFQILLIALLIKKNDPLYDNILWKDIFAMKYNHTNKRSHLKILFWNIIVNHWIQWMRKYVWEIVYFYYFNDDCKWELLLYIKNMPVDNKPYIVFIEYTESNCSGKRILVCVFLPY